jgi:hypothetical protein
VLLHLLNQFYLVLSYHYNVIVLLITELLKDYRVDAQRFTKKEVYSPSTTQLLEEQLRYSDTIILNNH